ncbi:hypothetical protein Tco_0434869 [Tanacetum coccineum]
MDTNRRSSKRQQRTPNHFHDFVHDLNKKKVLIRDSEMDDNGMKVCPDHSVDAGVVESDGKGKSNGKVQNKGVEIDKNDGKFDRKTFVEAIAQNLMEYDKTLECIPTEIDENGVEVVVFDDIMVAEGSKRWDLTLCGFFVGYRMSVNELRYNLRRMWSRYGFKDIVDCHNGVFFMKFHHEEGLNQIHYSHYQYAVSIKEDMAYPCLHSPKTTKETSSIRHIQKTNTPYWKYEMNIIFWNISNVVPTPRNSNTSINDPNITMEEYIRLEEEKAQKRGKVFNWETAKYGKIWYDENIHDLRSVETEFPAIAFTNEVSSGKTLSYEPTNEFPVIVYNDAQTSKSDLLTESNFNPQHIDEFDLNDETSLSEYKEEEQNVLYFNDLFPFNIIHSDDFKSEIDNDDNDIDIILSSNGMAPLPPRDQRHIWLCYQVEC